MKPIGATTAFAFLNSAFRITYFFVRIAEVGSENEVFVRTITVVRNDFLEVERLLSHSSVQARLLPTPNKLVWIKGSLQSTKSVLNEIGRRVEKARMEQQALGSVKFEIRLKWIFNDHEKLVNRQTELPTCHHQLSNVLANLVGMEDVVAATDPPKYKDATCCLRGKEDAVRSLLKTTSLSIVYLET
ncbi:uncharacterized protein N0V89_002694 [Didymosphaeria variabile]|uniref:Uncharacterized protein n=1 Tax=Didymosphaeria variabile TaxID=1932322 RepID=A0A9W9CEN0_9PLEO|nr:uncharacterized protein N0V89_002694 [Didymosphaeria variabile]KAJ4358115.1 hypothetical protein N0V89_002694 [Didymosphaeria variabile]